MAQHVTSPIQSLPLAKRANVDRGVAQPGHRARVLIEPQQLQARRGHRLFQSFGGRNCTVTVDIPRAEQLADARIESAAGLAVPRPYILEQAAQPLARHPWHADWVLVEGRDVAGGTPGTEFCFSVFERVEGMFETRHPDVPAFGVAHPLGASA